MQVIFQYWGPQIHFGILVHFVIILFHRVVDLFCINVYALDNSRKVAWPENEASISVYYRTTRAMFMEHRVATFLFWTIRKYSFVYVISFSCVTVSATNMLHIRNVYNWLSLSDLSRTSCACIYLFIWRISWYVLTSSCRFHRGYLVRLIMKKYLISWQL